MPRAVKRKAESTDVHVCGGLPCSSVEVSVERSHYLLLEMKLVLCRIGENKMMMSSSSLSIYVVLWKERQVFTRKFVRLGKKC